jgi:uncharacterized protein (TIGR02145 family)
MKLRLLACVLTLFASAIILTVVALAERDGLFTDTRDGKIYRTVTICGTTWMAENLNFIMDSSWCYDNADSNCVKYGRLYNWRAATEACPAGWRLPTQRDWVKLRRAAWPYAGRNLKSKSPDWNGRDRLGFSALPGGNRRVYPESERAEFGNIGWYGSWWTDTVTMHSIITVAEEPLFVRFYYICKSCDYLIETDDIVVNGNSVRCVLD